MDAYLKYALFKYAHLEGAYLEVDKGGITCLLKVINIMVKPERRSFS